MRHLIILLLAIMAAPAFAQCDNLLDYSHRTLATEDSINLCEAYQGKVLLVVNTASQCGYTGQFKELESLYQKYREDGLVVLGFPSDSFKQEHNNEDQTAKVCYINYGVTFPMFATSSVRGKQANALFLALAAAQSEPTWNFHKYLIGRDGTVLQSFVSRVAPLDSPLEAAVKTALAQ